MFHLTAWVGRLKLVKGSQEYKKFVSESICMIFCGTKLEKATDDSCKAPVLHSAHLKHHKGLKLQDNKTL